MSSSQPAFQTAVGEDVRFGNHAGQTHRILEREGMERRAEANALRALRGGSKHCKRIRRNRELLEEVMIDNRINIKSALVGMLHLPHDFPSHVVVRLARRRLNFAVDSKSHVAPLLLPFCRMRPLARGALAHVIRNRPDFMVFCLKVEQRLPFANHHILNISDEDSVISCVLCCIQSALDISQRPMQHWSSVPSAIKLRSGFFLRVLVDTSRASIVFRNRALIRSQNIHSKSFLGVKMRMRPRPVVDTDQYQWRVQLNRSEGVRGHSMYFAFVIDRYDCNSRGERTQRFAKLCLCDTHKIPKLRDGASVGGSCKVLPCKAQCQLNLARIEYGARRAI